MSECQNKTCSTYLLILLAFYLLAFYNIHAQTSELYLRVADFLGLYFLSSLLLCITSIYGCLLIFCSSLCRRSTEICSSLMSDPFACSRFFVYLCLRILFLPATHNRVPSHLHVAVRKPISLSEHRGWSRRFADFIHVGSETR